MEAIDLLRSSQNSFRRGHLVLLLITLLSCSKDEHVPQIVGFTLNEVEGFKVYIEDDYRNQLPDEADEAVWYLALELSEIRRLITKDGILTELEKVNIFLERSYGIGKNMYYKSLIWPGEHYLRYQSIIINNPYSFIKSSKGNWSLILHEMAHAFHNRVLGFNNSQIRQAFANAMEKNLYENFYAATDYKEYFAELTNAIFNNGQYRPRNRNELQAYDSLGFVTLHEIWLSPNDSLSNMKMTRQFLKNDSSVSSRHLQ